MLYRSRVVWLFQALRLIWLRTATIQSNLQQCKQLSDPSWIEYTRTVFQAEINMSWGKLIREAPVLQDVDNMTHIVNQQQMGGSSSAWNFKSFTWNSSSSSCQWERFLNCKSLMDEHSLTLSTIAGQYQKQHPGRFIMCCDRLTSLSSYRLIVKDFTSLRFKHQRQICNFWSGAKAEAPKLRRNGSG